MDDKGQILDYSTRRTWREHWLIGRWMALPAWMFALFLYLAVWLFDGFGPSWDFDSAFQFVSSYVTPCAYLVVLCIPGAVKRLRWGQGLLMIAIGCGLYMSEQYRWTFRDVLPFPYSWLPWTILAILAVCVAECLLARPRNLRSLFWAVPLAIAGACAHTLIIQPLMYANLPLALHRWRYADPGWGSLLDQPVRLLLVWLIAPLCLRLPRPNWRVARAITTGALAVTFVAFFLFEYVIVYSLATRSLLGHGPFRRSVAAEVLGIRHRASDAAALWQTLETADWSEKEQGGYDDYRKTCILMLSRDDANETAARLAKMLQTKPSQALASYSAQVLGQQKQYGAAPVLMRYALLGAGSCTDALEQMRIPQAAFLILRDVARFHDGNTIPFDMKLEDKTNELLTELLGGKGGATAGEWAESYDRMIAKAPTPLSPEQAAETNRVIDAILPFGNANQALSDAAGRLAVQRLNAAGKSDLVQKLQSVLSTKRRLTLPELLAAGLTYSDLDTADQYISAAKSDLRVPYPDFDAPDTASLEQEFKNYRQRVTERINKVLPPVTAPATTRKEE